VPQNYAAAPCLRAGAGSVASTSSGSRLLADQTSIDRIRSRVVVDQAPFDLLAEDIPGIARR